MLQVFLVRTPDVTGVDKAKLQQQILATIFSNGEGGTERRTSLPTCSMHGLWQAAASPIFMLPATALRAAGLAPYYEHLCTELGWTPDQAKLTEMQGANLKQLEELDAKIKASSSSMMHACLPFGQQWLHAVAGRLPALGAAAG